MILSIQCNAYIYQLSLSAHTVFSLEKKIMIFQMKNGKSTQKYHQRYAMFMFVFMILCEEQVDLVNDINISKATSIAAGLSRKKKNNGTCCCCRCGFFFHTFYTHTHLNNEQ